MKRIFALGLMLALAGLSMAAPEKPANAPTRIEYDGGFTYLTHREELILRLGEIVGRNAQKMEQENKEQAEKSIENERVTIIKALVDDAQTTATAGGGKKDEG